MNSIREMKNDEIVQIIAKLNEEKAVATRCIKNIKKFDFGRIDSEKEKNDDQKYKPTPDSSFEDQNHSRKVISHSKFDKKRTPSGNFCMTRGDNNYQAERRPCGVQVSPF